ncbi:MAG: 2-deoxystreptamine N-acetyl-D-glucosaminyltransferase [Anaerolineales bacterium]|nr:2-deoxystreptamine N-acetyl-D-glucosaminyltransferase [Anaerolineales bacterium]
MPKPIEVCLIAKYFSPTFSGAGERFRRYAPGLKERGINLTVWTLHQPGMPEHEMVDGGIAVHRIPIQANRDQLSFLLLQQTAESFRKYGYQPDVLHLLHHSTRGVPLLWKLRWFGLPSVISLTMMPPQISSPLSRLKLTLRNSYRFSPLSSVIVSSRTMAHRAAKQGVDSKLIEVIPNGVDLCRFSPLAGRQERERLRLQLGFKPEDEIILFVGALRPRKGADVLIAAWGQMAGAFPRSRLVIVGPAYAAEEKKPLSHEDREFSKKIENLVFSTPAPERISRPGVADNVEQYMKCADVFVLPSNQEGMPNVLLEAMASGLPCVLTPFDGLSDDYGSAGGEYLLVERDTTALANMLMDVLQDDERRAQIGQSARIWMERRMDVNASLDRMAQLYLHLAQVPKRKP